MHSSNYVDVKNSFLSHRVDDLDNVQRGHLLVPVVVERLQDLGFALVPVGDVVLDLLNRVLRRR